jgi:multiple sugar transport system substrate-binding protein
VHITPNQSQPPRIYLTALLGIALGLVWLMMLSACSRVEGTLQMSTQAVTSGTRTPYATRTRASVSRVATDTPATRTPRSPAVTPKGIRASEEDLRGVRIEFWHAWEGELEEILEDIVAEFNRTNQWGITVDARAYNGLGALGDAFASARQEGGKIPDLLSGFNYQAIQWDIGGKILVDLTPYVNDPVLGFSAEEINDFQPVFWSQDMVVVNSTVGRIEKRLGIPLHSSAQVLYYNLTWAEELGYVELPNSLSDFRVQACAASDGLEASTNEMEHGGWMITPEATTLLGWIYAYGGEVDNPQENGYRFNTEQAARAFAFLRSMVDSGCAWVGADLQAADVFAVRGALVYAGSMAGLEAQEAAMRQADNGDEWTVMAFPAANGKPAIVSSAPTLVVTQSTPENELAAWLLIKWLVSPQNQAAWVRASGYYPTRASTLDLMGTKLTSDEHWSAAVALLPHAHAEPGYASWRVMRWALSDAMKELLSPEFDPGEIPALLVRLDAVAEEIHTQVR